MGEGDDRTALESRLKGEEGVRDGALNAAQALFDKCDPDCTSDRTKHTMKELFERGRYPFEDRNTMGDYMLVLQRGNQALFADQKLLLAKIKKIKKDTNNAAAPVLAAPSEKSSGYGGVEAPVPVATAGA